MYRLEFMDSILSQREFCQNFENAVKLWENDLIFMRKLLVFDSNESYKFRILLWIDQLQGELHTDFWLALSVLHDDFHALFDFIFPYFDLILLVFWTLNFKFLFYVDLNHSMSASAKLTFFYQHHILSALTCW